MTAERDALAERDAFDQWASTRWSFVTDELKRVAEEGWNARAALAAQPDDVERWGNADTDETGRKSGWHQRADGYWTPWHIAAAALRRERADRDRLAAELREIGIALNDPAENLIETTAQCVTRLRADRDRLAAEVERLRSFAALLDAVVEAAQTEFVRVPYGASHEDVAQINEWHAMAKEARAYFAAIDAGRGKK